jgi:hypothetical protein
VRKLPVFECLIISPGDVTDERRAVAEEIMRWNGTSGRSIGAIVAPAMWETHARPAQTAAAQDVINEQLVDDCDFGIALFWSRLGTPTAKSASGAAEEMERLKTQTKDVLVYFKTASIPQPVDVKEYERLEQYRKGILGLTGRFASADELRGRLHGDLTTLVTELLGKQARAATGSPGGQAETESLIDRVPTELRERVSVRWLAYKDAYGRDKYSSSELSIADVDRVGRTVHFECKPPLPRPGIIRVPIAAIQEVWADAPNHWSVRIAGRIDPNDLTYSP